MITRKIDQEERDWGNRDHLLYQEDVRRIKHVREDKQRLLVGQLQAVAWDVWSTAVQMRLQQRARPNATTSDTEAGHVGGRSDLTGLLRKQIVKSQVNAPCGERSHCGRY